MGWKFFNTAGLVIAATCFVSAPSAQTLPPLLANLSASPENDYAEKALVDRIAATFPKDISSATLAKLLDLDGFEIEDDADAVTAKLTEYEFPCITSYIVTWTVSDAEQIEDMNAAVDRNCV